MANRPTHIVEVDFVNDPSSGTETWTNITPYVRALGFSTPLMDTTRGRNYELARTQAGSMTMTLDNTDGRFDPTNLASPYYTGSGNPGGAAGLVISRRRIRVRATWSGTTYNVWRGYVEDWPQTWDDQGFYGASHISCSDALSVLARIQLDAMPVEEANADFPVAFYRLNEASGSATAGNIGSVNQPTAVIVAGTTVGGTYQFGGTAGVGNLGADPSTGLTLTPTLGQFGNTAGYALEVAKGGQGPLLSSAGGWTVECWMQSNGTSTSSPTGSNNTNSQILLQTDGSAGIQVQIYLNAQTGYYSLVGGIPGAYVLGTANVTDSAWHHVALTLDTDGKTVTLYIDGVSQGSTVAGATQSWRGDTAIWGAEFLNNNGGTTFYYGSLKNIAYYSTRLSAARITAHSSSGSGFVGDNAGGRIQRLLTYAAWPTALRNIATGDSACGLQLIEGQKVLTAIEQINATELGSLFIDSQGRVAFVNRKARQGTSAVATFGEQEFHYVQGTETTHDPREVYNDVTVARDGGATVHNVNGASQTRFFPSSLSQQTSNVDDATSVYMAQYLATRYARPVTRIPSLVLDPQSDPSLWPQVLGREIGDRITVKRRPPGRTISADYFVEAVQHKVTAMTWQTTWLLSPASLENYKKLDDNTYGRLGDGGLYTLSASITSSATSLTVAFATTSPTWTTAGASFPLTIQVDQEQMTVTAIAAASGTTQVFTTVARGANGSVAAAHSAGASVSLVNAYAVAL